MTVTAPVETTYGVVRGTILSVVKDGPDEGDEPDFRPAIGRVEFRPSVERVTLSSSRVILAPEIKSFDIDASGEIHAKLVATDIDGGVPVDWTYKVTVALKGRTPWVTHIHVPGGTESDLSDLIPVSPSGGVLITKGDPGEPGEPGRGIASITNIEGGSTATVTYTDGTTSPLPLPVGLTEATQVIKATEVPTFTADESTVIADFNGAAALQELVNLTDEEISYSPVNDPWAVEPYADAEGTAVPDAPTDVLAYRGSKGASLVYGNPDGPCVVRVWVRSLSAAYLMDKEDTWTWGYVDHDGGWHYVDLPIASTEQAALVALNMWSPDKVVQVARLTVYAVLEDPIPEGSILYKPASGSTPSELWWVTAEGGTVSDRITPTVSEMILTGLTYDDLKLSTGGVDHNPASAQTEANPSPSIQINYGVFEHQRVKGDGYFTFHVAPYLKVNAYPWAIVTVESGSTARLTVNPSLLDPGSVYGSVNSINVRFDGKSSQLWRRSSASLTPVTVPPGTYYVTGSRSSSSATSISLHFHTLASAPDLSGSGMPNGVVTASPGTYYTDTAGTNGARRWFKKFGTGNTGWLCVEGDTGQRYIGGLVKTAQFQDGWGYAYVRRIDNLVTITLDVYAKGPLSGTTRVLDGLPVGFGTPAPTVSPVVGDPTAQVMLDGGILDYIGTAVDEQRIRTSFTVGTTDSWPTVLPGTPS